jgi:hypothetical protein
METVRPAVSPLLQPPAALDIDAALWLSHYSRAMFNTIIFTKVLSEGDQAEPIQLSG